MRIALITDTHYGIRNDSTAFLDYFERFYSTVFFPYLEEHKIDTIIMLGDTFDRRKYTNHLTLYRAKQMYFDKLAPYNVHMIIGNHDIFHRNSLKVNSVQLVLGEYDKLHFIDHPQELEFNGLKIAMIPWICADNKDETVEFINTTSAPIAMGHLELAGFAMYKGVPNAHGEDPKLFANFESVYSGHYHHRSSAGNINYLGAPLEYTCS